jgi:flavin reductase (DIM6/NTAB) family NADH-FMN oxidoreductase RutF
VNLLPASAGAADVRAAMSRVVTGVVVATTRFQDEPVGMTINSFTSVTLDPPIVLICLNTTNRGYTAIVESGGYALNVLAGSHRWIATLFATPGLSNQERFRQVEHHDTVTGAPVIAEAAAWMDCRVVDLQHVGTHGLFFGQVVAAAQDELDEVPLAYYRREMYPLRLPGE